MDTTYPGRIIPETFFDLTDCPGALDPERLPDARAPAQGQ